MPNDMELNFYHYYDQCVAWNIFYGISMIEIILLLQNWCLIQLDHIPPDYAPDDLCRECNTPYKVILKIIQICLVLFIHNENAMGHY